MNPTIEERQAAVQRAIIELEQTQGVVPVRANWLERFRGSFKDQPAFNKVVEYCRQWRHSDRPEEDGDS